MKIKFYSILYIALLLTASCSGEKESGSDDKNPDERVSSSSNKAEVSVMTLEPRMFSYDIVSNGKVTAGAYADMNFASSDAVIDNILVKNGQRVAKGQTLATLDRFSLDNELTKATAAVERAQLELADALIGQGYDPDNLKAVPDEIMRLARLRSGLTQAEADLAKVQRSVAEATMKAPFDGVVANLFQKTGNRQSSSEPFCRIISTSGMEVDFPVLESELSLIKVGDLVECSPYTSDNSYSGRVSEINPVVDKDGMVKVRATISGNDGLYDGMNVRVNVKRNVERALVIPKSALVLRSGGRKVVFTHSDGKAIWNYVNTSLENMNEYVVTDGLEEGMEVIVGGNINLSHEAPVKVIKD